MSAIVAIIAALVVGPILIHIGSKWGDSFKTTVWDMLTVAGVITTVISLFMAILILPTRDRVNREILRFRVTKCTIEEARNNNRENWIERAAILPTIVEKNAWLAKEQADNKGWFLDIYTPDEVDDFEPLK